MSPSSEGYENYLEHCLQLDVKEALVNPKDVLLLDMDHSTTIKNKVYKSIAIIRAEPQYATEDFMMLRRDIANKNIEGHVDVEHIQIVIGALLDVKLAKSSINRLPRDSVVDVENHIALINLNSKGLDTWLQQHENSEIRQAIQETQNKAILVVCKSPFSSIERKLDGYVFWYREDSMSLPSDVSVTETPHTCELKMSWKSLQTTWQQLWKLWSKILRLKVGEEMKFSPMFCIRYVELQA
jgi:hypothetical protein